MLRLTAIVPFLATTLSVATIPSAQAVTISIQDCRNRPSNLPTNNPIVDTVIRDMNGESVTNVTGVQDLQICVTEEIEGVRRTFVDTYDVNFTLNSFDSIFGDPNDPGFDSCEVGVIGNGLCFWGEGGSATSNTTIAIQAMNNAINSLDPIPLNIEDEDFPLPFPNTRQFYLIPHSLNQGQVTSEQGRFDTSLELPWTNDIGIVNDSVNARMYTEFQLTGREEVFEIPESSNLVGIIVAGASILLFTQSNKF
ncbi:MAG: hypothetical protein QNJ64_04760 [Crocosphaera sp.]|nr:hypothetical protein [Crocosphaera sp.]